MVLTAAQTNAFFTDAAQMGIPAETVIQMVNEGISTVDDLIDFDKDAIDQMANNLRRPPGGAGAFAFGARSSKRLLTATKLVRFYDTIGRNITAANIAWNPIMRNFQEQWKALEERREEGDPETPIVSKSLPIIKWTESFQDHLHRCIGIRLIPLSCVIRTDETVPPACPPQATNQPYSEQHGSVEGDLIARASHNHGLFRSDNADVCYKLEEATRGATHANSIAPFKKAKDGRSAFQSLTGQCAGADKWELELKKQNALLNTRKWKGQGNFTLEKFCQQHRNAYVTMVACAEHVAFQLPNEHSRVGFLLDAIENDAPKLQAAIANVEEDTGDGTEANPGKRNDFELAVSYVLPKDPVAKKREVSNERGMSSMSDATAEISAFGDKPGIGNTGVHLRWHSKKEFKQLNQDQKDELMKWREHKMNSDPSYDPKGDKGPKKGNKNDRTGDKKRRTKSEKKAFAAAVEKKATAKLEEKIKEAAEEEQDKKDMKSYIVSLFQSPPTSSEAPRVNASATTTSKSPPVTLRSTLNKAKN